MRPVDSAPPYNSTTFPHAVISFLQFPSQLIATIKYTMILRSALVAGVLALQASAFLVPLEVVKEVEAAKAQLESLWVNKAITVELACPGCTFYGPQQDGIEYSGTDENTIVSRIEDFITSICLPVLQISDEEITGSQGSRRGRVQCTDQRTDCLLPQCSSSTSCFDSSPSPSIRLYSFSPSSSRLRHGNPACCFF